MVQVIEDQSKLYTSFIEKKDKKNTSKRKATIHFGENRFNDIAFLQLWFISYSVNPLKHTQIQQKVRNSNTPSLKD